MQDNPSCQLKLSPAVEGNCRNLFSRKGAPKHNNPSCQRKMVHRNVKKRLKKIAEKSCQTICLKRFSPKERALHENQSLKFF